MPPKVGVGVAAFIFENDQILMLQRIGSHGAGTWSVPGGWLQPGESILEAAEREVLEEVGLSVTAVQEFGYTEDHFPEGIHDVCFTIVCVVDPEQEEYVAHSNEPEKVLNVTWIPIRDLGNMNLFQPMQTRVDQGMVRGINDIMKKIPYGS